MKIVIDGRFYGLENAGLGRYTIHLIEELSKIDRENNYTVLLRKSYFNRLNLPDNFSQELVDFQHYSTREQFNLAKIINKLNPDIVHFLHFNVPLNYRHKFVVTIHDLLMHKQKGLEATTLNPFAYALKRLGYKTVFAGAVKNSKSIIVPTKFVKNDILRTYKVPPEKIKVIYEGVDMGLSVKNDEEILKKYDLTEPYFLYVGSAYPHKNLKRVTEAVLAQKVTFAISCARNIFTKRLERIIKELKAEQYIKLLGFVPDEELSLIYKNSLGFIYASLMEGFGLPGLEAMASGTLVLASDISVFREIYNSHAIYFNPYDFSDIAKKMGYVMSLSKEKRGEIIKGSQEFVKKYSWSKMAKETLEVYNAIIKS